MQCKHCIILSFTEVEIIYLDICDQSQLRSYCAYPFREVRSDDCVLEIPQDAVMNKRSSQGRDVVEKY
jgi:hypothetical protein